MIRQPASRSAVLFAAATLTAETFALFLRAAGMLLLAGVAVVVVVLITTSPVWLAVLLMWAMLG